MRVCVTTQAVTRASGKGLQRAAVLYSACRLDSSELKSPNNWTSPQPWGTPAGPEREQSQPQKSNFPPFLLSVLSAMCFEMCHKVFYLFGCGCEWRVMIHTKEQALMFWVFFFFFFFKHKYQEILLTERKYIVHRSCKGAFSILFTHTGQSEEMESVTSPTAHSYFSTLWHLSAQLNHQMCLFFKQWYSLRKSSWIKTLWFIKRGSQLIRSHSEFQISSYWRQC